MGKDREVKGYSDTVGFFGMFCFLKLGILRNIDKGNR